MMRSLGLTTLVLLLCGGLLTGCTAGFGEKAQYGITFYCPGAGNVDMGDAGIREGLANAGYRGQVARLTWTISFNPAVDQAVRINARLGGQRLARYIEDYIDKFPGREVNLIGLSAGTGVAIWALEDLKPGYQVNSVVLLASSLHYRYDIRRALPHVRGQIHCYYSPNDFVLTGLMKAFGTIDGVFGEDGAGAVGLQPPHGSERVVNIEWRKEFEQLGYYGGHTDGTAPRFVCEKIAPRIMGPAAAAAPETAVARRPGPVPPGAPQDARRPAETPAAPAARPTRAGDVATSSGAAESRAGRM